MSVMPMLISAIIGVILIVLQFFLSRTRLYFIYLGASFVLFSPSLIADGNFRWMYQLLAGIAVLFALYEAILESRDRLQRLREEQRDREAAFSDYMHELNRIEQTELKAKYGGAQSPATPALPSDSPVNLPFD